MAEVQPLTKANLLEFLRSQNITIKSTKLPVEPSDPDSLELDTSFDFYEFLGIDENFSRDVVIGAYQAMWKLSCPESTQGMKKRASEKPLVRARVADDWEKLLTAYHILTDEERRAKYDAGRPAKCNIQIDATDEGGEEEPDKKRRKHNNAKPRQAKPAKPSKPAKRNKKEFGPKDANGDPNIFDTMAMCEGREGRKGSPISIWCLEDGQELMGLRPRIGFGGLRDKDCWSGKNVYPIVPELPTLQSRSF
ncbi:hypothetical protein DL95DRAFT_519911 [Leptodontidium sp. 2 PMI_412]|nr:hypothetical protein DL95DRAFT_519911 [Leptodontidium sp. 2 PMI_412]